jgi:Tfp pilus assembly pilus retraction ATPase PilT
MSPTETFTAVSTIVSVLALAISAYSMKKTNDFNRRQNDFIETNDKLNKMLLDKEQHETLTQRQADISANFLKFGRGDYRLKVFNRGKNSARNVRIVFPSGNEILIESDLEEKFPMPALEPQQSVELIAAVCMDSPRRMDVEFVWDDQSGEDRKKLLHLTL